jgi:C1A family cysteine protease
MVGVVLAGVIVLPSLAFAAPAVSLSQVQQAIQANKAKWTAHETWVSRLPHDQIQRMLGLKHIPAKESRFSAALNPSATSTSPNIDWRNKDGVNWVSPILNQGNCGSCVAFSTIGTLETQMNITSGIPGFNPTYSAEALFMCGGASCESGWEPSDAAQYLQSTGVPDEACMPYTSGATGNDVACSEACSDMASRSLKITGYSHPSGGLFGGGGANAVKAALQNGPVVTTMTVYSDFLYYSGGVYKHTTGSEEGGHAVSIVGFDDTQQAWIVRNSWGPDWGANGFVYVAYSDDSGVGDDTYGFQLPQPNGYITMASPIDRSYISGKIAFNAESTFPNTSSVTFSVSAANGAKGTMTGSPEQTQYASMFDSSTVADGQYDVVATAQYSGKTVNSQHAIVYVVNHAPTAMSVTITGTDHDLTKPLSDRIVFNLSSSTGMNVPLSLLTFHAAQNGKDIYTKMSQIVVDQMTFGWRTGSVPDGSYDIYFTGDLATNQGAHYTATTTHTTVQVQNGSGSASRSPVVSSTTR